VDPVNPDILVGIDGSIHSQAALAWAAEEAQLRDVRVRAVLCWSYAGIADSGQKVGTTEADALAVLEAAAATLPQEQRGLVDLVPVNDLPVRGILDAAADAAMIVVGSRGRGGVKGLVLGSVSRTIVERSPVPVAVIPLQS
jgi:nucleotide-binding universal stress UspA family protein